MPSARTARGSLTLSTEKLPVLVQVGQEEAVDQCGLPQARLTCPQIQGRGRLRSEGPTTEPGQPVAPATPPGSLAHSPATMSVKSKPFFTDFRCTWLGSVAKPTYCLSISWGQGQGRSGVPWGSWAAPCRPPSRLGQGGSGGGQSPQSGAFQWQKGVRPVGKGQEVGRQVGGWLAKAPLPQPQGGVCRVPRRCVCVCV